MSSATAKPPAQAASPVLDPVAGVLSFLIPGLGQISQGRITKGLVFFVSLYSLFFYGMFLGEWKNVYILSVAQGGNGMSRLTSNLADRPHYIGQFFIGITAWPAIAQYMVYDKDKPPVIGTFEREPPADEINRMQQNTNRLWDLGWVYTVIAGALNVLVIYDAVAGPAFREVPEDKKKPEPPKK